MENHNKNAAGVWDITRKVTGLLLTNDNLPRIMSLLKEVDSN